MTQSAAPYSSYHPVLRAKHIKGFDCISCQGVLTDPLRTFNAYLSSPINEKSAEQMRKFTRFQIISLGKLQ